MNKKRFSLKTITVVALLSALLALGVSVSWDKITDSNANDHYYNDSLVPSQPALFTPQASLPSFVDIAKQVKPAVVNVSTKTTVHYDSNRPPLSPFGGMRDPSFDDFFEKFFQGPREQSRSSLGSGFIINEKGYILTNNHVVAGADEIEVKLDDKRKFDAKVIGTDSKTDIAIIQITGKNLPFVRLGNSDDLQVGEWVMAVGNPFGLGQTVTVGIVSAKDRIIGAGPYDNFIQTDASINPGNSGGPLFNVRGEVVGINTAIVAAGQGIGFAIPVNLAKDLVPQLITEGKVTRGWLGVGIQEVTEELAKSFHLKNTKGALLASVFPDSPAAVAGLKEGDIITHFDGKEIHESHELPTLVAQTRVGKVVKVNVVREGRPKELSVKIAEMEKGKVDARTEKDAEELGLLVRDIPPEEARELELPHDNRGVFVIRVEQNGPAARAGVRPGDVLLKVNDMRINNVDDYIKAIRKVRKGDIARLFVKRENATIFFAFTK